MKTIAAAALTESPSKVPLLEAQTHAFMITRFREPTFHFYWHYHSEVELVWIRHGSGLRYVGRTVEPFKSGDLVLLGPNLPHTWGSAPDQRGDAEWTVIQFQPERWGAVFWQMPELRDLRKLLRNAGQGLHFVGRQVWEIGEIMEKMASLRPYSFEALARFIDVCRRLLVTPSRSLNSRPQPASAAQPDPRLQQALALVDTLSGDTLPQAEVAARIHMGPAVFSRWFKKQMGRTFQRYLNEVRVARVCARLADSDESVTAVAMECGFNNLANFNRRFLEITGLTPRTFRAETRGICARRARTFIVRHGLHGALRLAVLSGQGA
ncbi:MAG: helix-turn-helix domain-containing protein [Verrucomicrobia bacterium]|nr:helix-turn-helix domain-containing protein [Verrucomicrobiota bacterium]